MGIVERRGAEEVLWGLRVDRVKSAGGAGRAIPLLISPFYLSYHVFPVSLSFLAVVGSLSSCFSLRDRSGGTAVLCLILLSLFGEKLRKKGE